MWPLREPDHTSLLYNLSSTKHVKLLLIFDGNIFQSDVVLICSHQCFGFSFLRNSNILLFSMVGRRNIQDGKMTVQFNRETLGLVEIQLWRLNKKRYVDVALKKHNTNQTWDFLSGSFPRCHICQLLSSPTIKY